MSNDKLIKNSIEEMLQEDKVIQAVKKQEAKDNETIEPVVIDVCKIIMAKINDNDLEFSERHGCLVLARAIDYLTQCMSTCEESYRSEYFASSTAVEKNLLASIDPKRDKNDNIIEDSYDKLNFTFPRLMMMASNFVEQVNRRVVLNTYADKRKELEAETLEELDDIEKS